MFKSPPTEHYGNIEVVNVMDIKPRLNAAHEEIKLRPRSKMNDTVVKKKNKGNQEWTMKNSVFAAYQLDTKQHLEQAFQSDYRKTKTGRNIEKLSDEDEKMAFKENLMTTFPVLKDVFRQYGAAYTSEVWNVGVNAWNQVSVPAWPRRPRSTPLLTPPPLPMCICSLSPTSTSSTKGGKRKG